MMFNYTFPNYTIKPNLNYRDNERLFYVATYLSETYFRHFLKDLKQLIQRFEKSFSLEYRNSYTGDSFVLSSGSFKHYSLFEIAQYFKTKLDYLESLKSKYLNYKTKAFVFTTKFSELTNSIIVPDLYFLSFASTDTLTSTNTPIVDTSFFSLQNSVSTYSNSTQYLSAKEGISYIDRDQVLYDHHKYFVNIPDDYGDTIVRLNLKPFDGMELFVRGVDLSSTAYLSLEHLINQESSTVIGPAAGRPNLHLLYSTHQTSFLIMGT